MSKERYSVEIDGKVIGPGHPIYATAEIGINHNGDLGLAKKLIDMAYVCGCDAVKFQKRTVDLIYSPETLAKPRNVPISVIEKSLNRNAFDEKDTKRIMNLIENAKDSDEITVTTRDQKNMLEFGKKEYEEINRYCKNKGITWYASPWDLQSVDFLEEFDAPCYKIASASLTDKNLLDKIKKTGKPIILSTGMSTPNQIDNAVNFLGEKNLVLLSCVSTYPTMNPAEQNLGWIAYLKESYSCPIGYSGHEPNTRPTILAMALGAEAIERHITLTRTMWGSDHASSLEPQGLTKILSWRNDIPILIGNSEKRVLDSEIPIRDKLRGSK